MQLNPQLSPGLGATPSYETLLMQVFQQQQPAMEKAWQAIQAALQGDSGGDPCNGLGGPASLVPQLQAVSDMACTVTHAAALASSGYVVNCKGADAASALAAQKATETACVLKYVWGQEYGPSFGTLAQSGSNAAVCLDPSYLSAVAAQVAAARAACAYAQNVMISCKAAGQAAGQEPDAPTGEDGSDPAAGNLPVPGGSLPVQPRGKQLALGRK